MNDPILDNFGELLIKRVRDKAIGDWEKMVNGEMKGASAERLRQQIHSFNPDQKVALLKVIPEIVDTTLHHLLFTLQQERRMELLCDGQSVRESSDGLAGELYGKQGWIARFSAKPKE